MEINNHFKQNYFFTSHINNLKLDETKPYSLYGTHKTRIFKDMSTDSFINVIFDVNSRDKLFNFVDYTFYEIFTAIPKIHILLNSHGHSLKPNEYITVIFKGGNVMSLFFDDITQKTLNSQVQNFQLNQLVEYLKTHGINIGHIDSDSLFVNSHDNVANFFTNQKKKFKISDVDYTMYFNINDPVRYKIISQIFYQILVNSLVKIRNFFDSYYESVRNTMQPEIEQIQNNPNLPFEPYDDPTDPNIAIIGQFIDEIKNENNKNFLFPQNITYSQSIENNFIKLMYLTHCFAQFLITSNNFQLYNKITLNKERNIKNIRLITAIIEYLELAIQYFNSFNINQFVINSISLLTIAENVLQFHLDNKKRRILDSQLYTLDSINNLMGNIAHQYNTTNNPEALQLYESKYDVIFDKKENFQKHNLIRQNQNEDLIFHNYVQNEPANMLNEIDIEPRHDTIINCINGVKLYDIISSTNTKYHYITYNNSINSLSKLCQKTFDLFRIKFNVTAVKPLFIVNGEIKNTYKLPSEFVDVSVSGFTDATREKFYNEVQEEGICILQKIHNKSFYFWNSYTLTQLFNDLLDVLFTQTTTVPWYDSKYDKRIIRSLILYYFIKITSPNNNCDWICMITDIFELCLSMERHVSNPDKIPFPNIARFILGKNYLNHYTQNEANSITNFILSNCLDDLDNLLYNKIIKINKYYKDFEILIKFIIFYGWILTKNCFNDAFNRIRINTNLIPYEPGLQITHTNGTTQGIMTHNNTKYILLLKTCIDNFGILLYLFNEILPNCKYQNLTNCIGSPHINNPCDHTHPVNINFSSNDYVFYNNYDPTNTVILSNGTSLSMTGGEINVNKKYKKYKIVKKN